MYASAMCVRIGAASQAAFEVIRQLWILSIQLFECLNVATQSMAASLLGAGDRAGARALLARATLLSVGVGAGVGGALLLLQRPLVAVFTSDATVTAMCLAIMPMISILMPVDAGASIADGGFIAAGQTNTLSAIQVSGSIAQFAALSWAAAGGAASALTVWAVLKLMSVFRFAGGAYMHFFSPRSAYLERGGGGGGGGGSSSIGSLSTSSSDDSGAAAPPAAAAAAAAFAGGADSGSESDGAGAPALQQHHHHQQNGHRRPQQQDGRHAATGASAAELQWRANTMAPEELDADVASDGAAAAAAIGAAAASDQPHQPKKLD